MLVKDADPLVMRGFQRRALRIAVAYLLATGVAWFSPTMGFYLYMAIVVVLTFHQIRSKLMQRLLRHT